MYESFWQLQCKPFDNAFDPALYYPNEAHQGALLKLRYALEQHCGCALLTGPSGIGKTMLIHDLLQRLGDEFYPRTNVVYPRMPAAELMSFLALRFGGPDIDHATLHASVKSLEQLLMQNSYDGQHAVIVLDEAHLLDTREHLEMVRLLTNFETAGRPNVTVVLVGQPPLLTLVERLPALEERLGVKCLLRPLDADETVAYIQHRLQAANAHDTIFDDTAMDEIYRISGGIPRRINRICDLSMLVAYADQRQTIHADQILAVCNELITVAPE